MVQVAVVGSGVAALMAVRTMCTSIKETGQPIKVTWFTARRKMGATQSALSKSPTVKLKAGDPYFDYGCQYMSPVSELFERELERWKELGLASDQFDVSVLDTQKTGDNTANTGMNKLSTAGWVGNGGMGPMLEALTFQTRDEFADCGLEHVSGYPEVQQQVVSIHRDENKKKWLLNTEKKTRQFGPYDYVIGGFSHPKRTDPFLKDGGEATKPMMNFLQGVKYNQFFALQVVLEKGLEDEAIKSLSACHVLNHDVLSFVADNSKKPHQKKYTPKKNSSVTNKNKKPHITLISTAQFAKKNQKCNRKIIQDKMLGSFGNLILKKSLKSLRTEFQPKIHRLNYWQDGRCVNTIDGDKGCLFDSSVNLGWCGDFCVDPSVDGAAQSGVSVAKFCLEKIEYSMLNGTTKNDDQERFTKSKWIESNNIATVDIGKFSHLRDSSNKQ